MELPPGAVLLDPDFGTTVVNATDVATPDVAAALRTQNQPIFNALEGWVQATRSPLAAREAAGSYETSSGGTRSGGLFERDRYVLPPEFFDQIRLAQFAVETDDVVSGVAEATESLAFSQVSLWSEDQDEEDIYNQIAGNISLDARLREIWRELFTCSQCYVAVLWGQRTFKVRGTTKAGNQRRRSIDAVVPVDITLLNPAKVIPVGSPLFGGERLAYIAERGEAARFQEILSNPLSEDDLVRQLMVAPYEPDRNEARELQAMGVDTKHLWLLNPTNVFRHTLTRSGYQRVAPVRMRTIFELLDVKHQLRQMERAHLIGATNFIVLITKGTDQHPARQEEIQFLQAQVRTVSRVPILVGDHRLSVEIVTPKVDNTLRAERWNTIDGRITGRLYQMFILGNYSAGAAGDDSIKLVKVIARGMESRRHMIRRTLEKQILEPLFDRNDQFTTPPKLQFHPRSIALDFDAAYASFLFDLRQSNELSRETILNQFDLDQKLEAENRKREKDDYDDIFKTQVPFSTANPALPNQPAGPADPNQPPPPANLPRDNGGGNKGGGNRNGGGSAPGSGQGQPPRRRAGRPKPKEQGDG
jgi:hypothetical protein